MIIKSYKFRLYPTEEQKILLAKHFGCVRHVYNWALEYKTKYYKEHKKNIHWMKLTGTDDFRNYKKSNPWIKEINSQILPATIGNLDNAYKNFFEGRASFPRFKKLANNQSFQVSQFGKVDVKNNKLIIPKFIKGKNKGIKCIFHRDIPKGKHGTYTVSKTTAGKYYVSIIIYIEQEIPIKPVQKNAIGLDFGLKTFITTSDGQKIQSPQYLKQSLRRLQFRSKKHSKTLKGGKNREKQRIKLAKTYEKITNQRKDFLHKLSHSFICKNQADTICIEDLNIKAMQKLWGKKISDLSWYEFTRQLQYKADWYGKNLIKIGRFDPSSRMCSKCGHLQSLSLKDRNWTCNVCNTNHDRDFNAAANIRDFGMNQYQLRQELSEVKPLEKKALTKNRKKLGETVFDELGKKKNARKYILKP